MKRLDVAAYGGALVTGLSMRPAPQVLGIPALVGFNIGRYAADLEGQPDSSVVAAALDALRGIYGGAVPDPEVCADVHFIC
jgi:hypothetical protein